MRLCNHLLRALRDELRRQAAAASGCDSGPAFEEHFWRLLQEYKRQTKP
jgi:hypothetical protein